MNTAIQCKNLCKRYGSLTAVDDLSLRVFRGKICVLVGLNGAGKSTTIRMLLGMVRPTYGEIHLLGRQIRRGPGNPWQAVGYLIETPQAYPELTVSENLELVRRLRPGTPGKAVDRVIQRLGLAADAHQRAAALSQGNAQRLGLAKALLHHPELLILDEPARGLDPAGMVEIRQLLLELAQDEGVTIFLSSHLLGQVAQLADRIVIIRHGRLRQELDPGTLEGHQRRGLVIGARDLEAAQALLNHAGYSTAITPDGLIEVTDPAALENPDRLAAHLVHGGHAPTRLHVQVEDLEKTFLQVVGVDRSYPK